jgi:hypothetical protein
VTAILDMAMAKRGAGKATYGILNTAMRGGGKPVDGATATMAAV